MKELSREKFTEMLNFMKKKERYIQQLIELIQKNNLEFSYSPYDEYNSNIIDLLASLFENEDRAKDWIAYWVYDLNYGDKYFDGCVSHGSTDIKLKTADDLFDYLTEY